MRDGSSYVRRHASVAGVAIGAALLAVILGAPASAGAKVRIKASISDNSQGHVWQTRKDVAAVKSSRSGRATVYLIAGPTRARAKRISAAARVRVRAHKRKKVTLSLTGAGRRALGRCSNRVIGVRVKVRPGHGRAAAVRSTRPLARTLGVCSVGSENPTSRPYFGNPIPTANAGRCDFFDPTQCLQPWPNDYFTVADGTTITGRRLNIDPQSTPANASNVHIDPTDWNRSDGFSTGQTIVLKVPGLETQQAFDNTGLVPITDIGRYADPNQPVVVIDTDTGQRQPIWVELDSQPTSASQVNLLIHPAKDFAEGHHFIVALRGLKNASDQTLQPPISFRVYRDRLITSQPEIESRRAQLESLFTELQGAGIQRANLYLAWDFTVSSEDNLTSRVLAMRDDALGNASHGLGDPDIANGNVNDGAAPSFTIGAVVDQGDPDPDGDGPEEAPHTGILRNVYGTLTVPCYLNADGCPTGSHFAFSSAADRTPDFNSTYTMDVPFMCIIPDDVEAGGTLHPARAVTFGHGLLDDHFAVGHDGERMNTLATEHNMVVCAVDWAGFATEDIGTVISILGDSSKFNQLTDRVQQSYINFMYLGRAMIHDNSGTGGFDTNAAFQVDPDGGGPNPTGSVIDIDPQNLYFEGISQGAVEGGALTALSPDIKRSVLNVGGMTYSVLLTRSSDWPTYEALLAYPDLAQRPLLLSMWQVLWDRAETNGYSQHAISDPYENTPSHQILLQADFGDFQVANVQAEVEARTMGLDVYDGGPTPNGSELVAGRHWSGDPLFGLTPIPSFPYSGSALVYWDGGPPAFTGTDGIGTTAPPNGNTHPVEGTGPGQNGADPHSYSRKDAQARQQLSDFFDGAFEACTSGGPCFDNGWDGVTGL